MNFQPVVYEGMLNGKGLTIAIVVSRFNDFITGKLLDGAFDALARHEVAASAVKVFRVPGTFEIPVVARQLAMTRSYDAVICIGAVIRGGTPHFDFIAGEVTKGIAMAAMESGRPVIYGVITCDTIEQAIERAGTKAGNKGYDAAMSAIEMANLFKQLTAS